MEIENFEAFGYHESIIDYSMKTFTTNLKNLALLG